MFKAYNKSIRTTSTTIARSAVLTHFDLCINISIDVKTMNNNNKKKQETNASLGFETILQSKVRL